MLRNRLIALGALILSLIAISVAGGPVTYGFFFFVLIVPAISLIYSIIVFLRFKVYQRLDVSSPVAGTSAAYYFTLRNEDRFAHSSISVGFYMDFSDISGIDADTEYELLPGTGINRETLLVCRYRGDYEVGIKTVTVTDYLRLFNITFKNREKLRVTVLPHLEILDSVAGLDEVLLAAREAQTQKDEPDVLVRDYVPGDDVRMISWKAMAKTGKPMIRKFIGENTPDICMIMEPHRYSDVPSEYLPVENRIIETLLAVSYYCLKRGIPAGVYTYDNRLNSYALSSTDSFEEFYSRMSSYHFGTASQGEMFTQVSDVHSALNAAAYILILHVWSDEARSYVKQLAGYRIPVMVYLIGDGEHDMPDTTDIKSVRFMHIGCEDKLKEVIS
ncbi:MAG: DUF58 domain-containing protein [Lachnospiraceae bacterium]|nr:DUF58 domain-containing protein [Lachnospiraceae bacterium]